MKDIRALWRGYRETGDPRVKEKLVQHYIDLVRFVVGRMRLHLPSHLEVEDLESAGILGLLSAIEDFDPELGVEFSTYARARIKGAILDELRQLDPLPRSIRQKAREIERALMTLEQKLGRPPEDEEVAAYLGLDLKSYYDQLGQACGFGLLSLDEPGSDAGEEEPFPLSHRLGDSHAGDPLQDLLGRERLALLGRLIATLPLRERVVIALYYQEGLTLQEIGAILEVSESRVSQLHSSALLRLRARLRRLGIGLRDLALEDDRIPVAKLSGLR